MPTRQFPEPLFIDALRKQPSEEPLFVKVGKFIEERPGSFLDVATRIPEVFRETPVAKTTRSVFPQPATKEEEMQNLALNFSPMGLGRVSKVVKPALKSVFRRLEPLAQKAGKLQIVPIEQVIKQYENTGSAIVGQGKGIRMVIKDEGAFVKVGLDTSKLVDTELAKQFPERTFATKKEAFDFIQQLQSKVKAIPQELEPLAIEARKYKSAEEFVKRTTKTSQEFGFAGEKYIQTDLPIKDIHGRMVNYMEYRDIAERGGLPKAGTRQITKPISVTVENIGDLGNTRLDVIDGNQRLRQAIANGDKTIPARIFVYRDWTHSSLHLFYTRADVDRIPYEAFSESSRGVRETRALDTRHNRSTR